MLADAVRAGVDGLPWLHASAYPELAPLAAQGVSLPESLRLSPRRMDDGAPALLSALPRR
jgi:hypothetical protein